MLLLKISMRSFAKVCIVGEVSSGLILNAWLLDEFHFCCHQSFQQ